MSNPFRFIFQYSSCREVLLRLVILISALVIVPKPLNAATNIWSGTNGVTATTNWSDNANWSGGTAPAGGDDVKFFDGGGTTVSNINNVVDGSFGGFIGSLQYGNTNNTHTTLIGSGLALTITNASGLVVGTPADIAIVKNLTNTITGAGGSLFVTNPAANI